jgi:deoxycytidine triphosphate deaminase
VILSDRTIRAEIEAGRIGVDPFDPSMIQPSSIDVRLDDRFLVFRSHTRAVIDVKQDTTDLTEMVRASDAEPFILHPGEFVLGSTAEHVRLPGDIVGRIEGKALSIETPVPTPFGWRRMGDLARGDVVFDERGRATLVVDATDTIEDRPCYEVEFADGTTVIADLTHQWVTSVKRDRKRGDHGARAVVITEQIAHTLKSGREYNHQVALCEPVEYAPKPLEIDPYVLGVWLGDGTSTSANITSADEQVLDEIMAAGYSVTKNRSGIYSYLVGGAGHTRDPRTGTFVRNSSLSSALRNLGLLGDKHIPLKFLQGSVAQRLSLLCGLMDSDGFADTVGRCEFRSTREVLADGVFELAASLGFRPQKTKDTATLNWMDCGPRYRIRFTPDRPVFRLERKLRRLKGPTTNFHRHRSIRAVRRIPSVPVRCIQVANPTGQFLVSRAFIPTHNSSLGRLGLLIHTTAGFVDAGFEGYLTLELSNVATLPITLYPGMKIGQISFLRMDGPAEHPYGSGTLGSKYSGQVGPTPSQYWKNFQT